MGAAESAVVAAAREVDRRWRAYLQAQRDRLGEGEVARAWSLMTKALDHLESCVMRLEQEGT